MKSDLTRLTFDPAKHYRGVHQQQGRVQLDSDWNEQADIVSHRVETETVDVVGHCGAPFHDDGFRLVPNLAALTPEEAARPGNIAPPANPPVPAGDLLITAGRFYAGGVLVINERLAAVSLQPDLPTPAELTASGLPAPLRPTGAGTYLAYLDVWPRHRTALEDGSLREIALGGPDTATRTKNTWQVKFLSVPAGTTCSSPLPAWDALVKPALGTLSAELVTAPQSNSPCIVEPGSGYRRLENQLYRVEVHQGGSSLAQTTFKWSRDNGSVVAKWVGKQAGSLDLQIENTGRDKVLGLSENQWVELTDDTREELGVPGLFVQIDKVEGDIVRLKAPHNAATEFAKFPRHPKLRRWEGIPAAVGKWLGPDGNEKTLSTNAGAAGLFELEDGVAVRFGAGTFRTGDYWIIPARTARPQLDWPVVAGGTTPAKIPPQGVPHHYCKLAVVTVPSGGAAPVISDCRPLFPPLTELTSLFYVGGDAQSATPNPILPPTTLLAPLPLPLEVGVANGEHHVVGARVRFTATSGNGVISGPGVDANGIVLTDDKGVARAAWALRNADPAGNPNTGHRVTAELLDSANTRVHLPVVFHATLNTAAKVAYDPKNCAGMNSAQPPVVTVQDALDHLCARDDDAADCCYSVGEIDGKPGDFPTLKEALAALFDQKTERSAICLSLLPGEHFLSQEIELEPKDAAVLKINGCNHAAHLFIEAPLLLRRFEGVVIRDISIAIIGEEARIRFDDCRLVEITHCVIVGRDTGSALLSFSEVGRLVASKNLLRALAKKATDSNDRGPSSFENIAGARTEADTSKYTAALLAKFEGMSAAERAAAVAKLKTEFAHAESKLGPAEAAAYKELLELLGGSGSSDADTLSKKVAAVRKLSAKRRAKEFADLTHVSESTTSARVPGTESMVAAPGAPRAPGGVLFEAFSIGVAILFEDAEADVTRDDNYILGEVRHLDDGTEKGPLTEAELKNFGPLFTSGAITLRPASLGFLRVRGNTIMRFGSGDALADQIRELIKNKKGDLPIWAGAQFTDNRFGGLDNFFVSARLMLTANQFAGGGSGTDGNAQDLALVIAARAAFTGNISADRTYLRHFSNQAAQAGNLGFTFSPAIP